MIVFSALMVSDFKEFLDLKQHGVNNIELTWDTGIDIDDRKGFMKASATLKKKGIKIVSHHAPLRTSSNRNVDISSLDKWDRKFAVRETQKSILAFNLMGSKGNVVIHLGRGVDSSARREHINMSLESMKEICDYASKFDIQICLENTLPGHLGCFLEELLEMRERLKLPLIKFCLDTGHYNLGSSQDDKLVFMAPDIAEMHIHDNKGDKDSHLVPGDGIIDWEKLFEILGKADRAHVFEIMDGTAPAIRRCLEFAIKYNLT